MKTIRLRWPAIVKSTWITVLTGVSLLQGENTSLAAFAGDSAGIFVNAEGPATMKITGQGSSYFQWGTPDGPNGSSSSLRYDNVAFSSPLNTSFKIGTLTYFNGASVLGSGASAVDLSLLVKFTAPSGIEQSFVYGMQLINTPNAGRPQDPAAADYVFLGSFPDKTFTFDGITYNLALEFGNLVGGGFTQTGNQLHVLEKQQATADLNGRITVVPEPSSVIAGGLLLLPLAGCVMRRLQQRSRCS